MYKVKAWISSNFLKIKVAVFILVCQNLLVPGRADLVGFEVEFVVSDVDVDDVAVPVLVAAVPVDCCLVVSSFSPGTLGVECVGGGRSPYNDIV